MLKILNWLCCEFCKGLIVGGLCIVGYVLVCVGLFEDCQVIIYWENQDGFIEEFENIELIKFVFVIDCNCIIIVGGMVLIDLMLKFIVEDYDEDFVNVVVD